MKKLFIISNENIFNSENEFYCDNIDLKSTPEGLNQKFEVSLIARKSKIIRAHKINIHNIKISKTIFSFLHSIYKTYRNDAEYLIISISPYTFISCLILKFLGKKPFVYLRSDGYGEYKSILGFFGPILYHLMFNITSAISNLISCRDYILKGRKGNIVNPSQLDNDWLCNYKKPNLEKINLLYVGRVRVEKGIFSLLKLIEDKNEINLTIVGADKSIIKTIKQKNVIVKQIEKDKSKLIKIYDDHNIFILPSFTEGHPMVILEALARQRPVIVFDEIKHIIGDKKGIFVCQRNYENLIKILNYIKNNYQLIQRDMENNKLPTNKNFIIQMEKFIS